MLFLLIYLQNKILININLLEIKDDKLYNLKMIFFF